ncbi:LPS-assembly protein LptD [Deinococcus radiophilus]|uniref:LPS-assembly protein LptD n=1 Tax=Deinococcus radiophilus TaxID=32062 RepID=A0A431W1Z3_9DEIO|nr:hypothetical protein [Deinococcus radiophilus]RTR29403.1 hypothetical protein EJ104_03160 [Deinococcus radiophilus]
MTVRRLRGLRALALGLLAAGGTLLSSAQAATVRIVDAGSLELRRFEDQELVIISADEDSPGGLVEVELDGETLRARRIEFNRTARTLTLVGGARYASDEGQDLAGEDLVVDLATNSLTGEDVLVSQGKLRIRGEELERVPGQLRAMGSYFTPCGGCGQTPNDYAFQAEQLILYPGDRLVAYRVQLLLADHPVLYLPVIVLPLNEPARQPRLSLGQDERDGFTAAADLPFSVSDHTLGTTLLRYYQNRPARFGVGVDLRSYSPVPYVDRADLYLLTDPKPFEGNQPQEGRDLDLDFSVRGRAPLELATSDLDYDLQVTRRDIGRSATDPLRGVTSVKFGARVEYPLFSAELNLYNLLNRDETRSQYTPLKWPEVVIDPKPYRSGNFSADARLTAGQYTAASNPDSSSASRQGVNITTTRLEEQHDISYSRPLWEGAQFSVRNRFTGRYYGTGARTVDLQAEARLDQRFGVRDQHSLNFTSEYIRYEGTSPFAFDRLSGTRIRAPQTLSLALVPSDGVLLSASHTHDLLADWDQQQATAFGVRINRYPVQLSGHLNHNFYTDTLERFSFSSTLGGQAPTVQTPPADRPLTSEEAAQLQLRQAYAWLDRLTLSANGGYTDQGGFQPLTLRATVNGQYRTNNFSVYATHDIQTPRWREVGLNANYTRGSDTVLNPLTFSTAQRVNLISDVWTGNTKVLWRGQYAFEESHTLNLDPAPNARDTGRLDFSVGTQGSGRARNWELAYGGPYDLRRGYWTAPTLRGSYTSTQPGERFRVSGTYNLPGLDQRRSELAQLSLGGAWQLGEYVSVAGEAAYTRTRSGTYPDDIATDRLSFSPLAVGVRWDVSPTTDLYFTGRLNQVFTWVDGELQPPGGPLPVLAVTLDRCCWAAQFEADLLLKRYRFSVGLPGSGFNTLLERNSSGLAVPLLTP